MRAFFLMVAALAFTPAYSAGPPTPSSEGAHVRIVSPADGDTVSSPVTVVFGLKNMGVAPAGVDKPGTGHHHLLVDVDTLPPLDRPLPADANHLHFGGGQTETTLELTPGRHTLQMILGDYTHTPHVPPVISPRITITVR